MSDLDRRRLLKSGFAAAAGLAVAGAHDHVVADEYFPIVDTHQHLWDRSRFRLAWITPGSVLDRNFLPADYQKAIAEHQLDVFLAVYMEVDVAEEQQLDEVKFVTDLCREKTTPTRAAVVSGRPSSPGFVDYLDKLQGNPYVKGLRQVLHAASTPPGHCRSEDFIRGIQELGKRGLSFDLCMRSPELSDGVKLVEKCPQTTFILDHCGNPNVREKPSRKWQDDIRALASLPNVAAKISGIIAGIDRTKPPEDQLAPFVNHVWESFGPDRVVFGGDWPVCLLGGSYATWVATLRKITGHRSKLDQHKLFHDNAMRIYRLNA